MCVYADVLCKVLPTVAGLLLAGCNRYTIQCVAQHHDLIKQLMLIAEHSYQVKARSALQNVVCSSLMRQICCSFDVVCVYCCSMWKASHLRGTPTAFRALTALWCHMQPCAKRVTSTLLSSASWVPRPLMMEQWTRPPCIGLAPQSRGVLGRDPHQVGRPSPTAP